MILDRDILALDKAEFTEARAERGQKGLLGAVTHRRRIDEGDNRQRPLLRARGERPRRGESRAAEPRDELASPHRLRPLPHRQTIAAGTRWEQGTAADRLPRRLPINAVGRSPSNA